MIQDETKQLYDSHKREITLSWKYYFWFHRRLRENHTHHFCTFHWVLLIHSVWADSQYLVVCEHVNKQFGFLHHNIPQWYAVKKMVQEHINFMKLNFLFTNESELFLWISEENILPNSLTLNPWALKAVFPIIETTTILSDSELGISLKLRVLKQNWKKKQL